MSYAHRFYHTSCKLHVSASFLPSSLGSVSLSFVISQHDCQIDHFRFWFFEIYVAKKNSHIGFIWSRTLRMSHVILWLLGCDWGRLLIDWCFTLTTPSSKPMATCLPSLLKLMLVILDLFPSLCDNNLVSSPSNIWKTRSRFLISLVPDGYS